MLTCLQVISPITIFTLSGNQNFDILTYCNRKIKDRIWSLKEIGPNGMYPMKKSGK